MDLDFFEQIILRESLTDQAYLAGVAEYAKEEYFQDPDIRKIFKVILAFFKERGVPPSIGEIKTRMLEDGDKKILQNCYNKIKDLTDVNSNDELIINTETFFKQRSLYASILKTAEGISQGKLADIGETLLDIEAAYNITLTDSLGLWYFRDLDKHIEELKTIYTPIPTGWEWFDTRTEGGLFPKTLNVFIGQVNVGKSIVLGNIATNLVQRDLNVVLISLEMSEFMYAKRISAQLSQIPCNMLKDNEEELKEAVAKIRKQIDSHLIIKEYPPKTITVAHIDGYLTKLKHKGVKVDVLVVDYLNLIKPVGKNLNSYEGVKEVAEALRALAFKYDIPTVSASQVNRCLVLDTKVVKEGIECNLGDIVAGDKILGSKGYVTVRHVYPKEHKDVYEITTKSGKKIQCSKEHMFPTPDGMKSIETGLSVEDSVFSASYDALNTMDKFIEDEIVGIRLVGRKETVDILVSNDNLFVANNILTHNSGFSAASPGMENVSESIALPATADVMCNIWQEEEEKELGIMHLGFIKNRFGPNFGKKTFRINYSTLTMAETNDDYFAPDGKEDEIESATNALTKFASDDK